MKVLVTGGSGFVGVWIIKGLVEAGIDVAVLDLSKDTTLARQIMGDAVDQVEWIHFLDAENPASHAAESQIQEVITVQPIITSNSNGSNTAEFFGTDDEEREIIRFINDIFYQARIEVDWLSENTWNNTFANIGDGGIRPFDDAFEIIDRGEEAEVTNDNSLNINVFFVEIAPGSGDLGENTTNGVALDGENGVTLQVGDLLPTFEEGRRAVARVAAHEISHNLGLEHVPVSNNLLVKIPPLPCPRVMTSTSNFGIGQDSCIFVFFSFFIFRKQID